MTTLSVTQIRGLIPENMAQLLEAPDVPHSGEDTLVRFWPNVYGETLHDIRDYLKEYASASNSTASKTVNDPQVGGDVRTGTWYNIQTALRNDSKGRLTLFQVLKRNFDLSKAFLSRDVYGSKVYTLRIAGFSSEPTSAACITRIEALIPSFQGTDSYRTETAFEYEQKEDGLYYGRYVVTVVAAAIADYEVAYDYNQIKISATAGYTNETTSTSTSSDSGTVVSSSEGTSASTSSSSGTSSSVSSRTGTSTSNSSSSGTSSSVSSRTGTSASTSSSQGTSTSTSSSL